MMYMIRKCSWSCESSFHLRNYSTDIDEIWYWWKHTKRSQLCL